MTLAEYVKFIGERLVIAEGKNDYVEAARLCKLLIDTLQEKLPELEKAAGAGA